MPPKGLTVAGTPNIPYLNEGVLGPSSDMFAKLGTRWLIARRLRKSPQHDSEPVPASFQMWQ